MKKVFLVLAMAAIITSCSLNDDDGQNVSYQIVPITNVEQLPDSLELGESYELLITSEESECSTFFDIRGEVRDSILTFAATNTIIQRTDCSSVKDTVTNEFPFSIRGSNSEDFTAYTFRFIQGFDSENEPIFLTRNIPIKASSN